MKNKQKQLGYAYLFFTIALFSTYEVVSKSILHVVTPLQINLIRFYLGGFLLLGICFFKRNYKVSFKDFLLLTAIGIINVVISMNLVLISMWVQGGRASISAALLSTNPLFVMLFAALFDNEKITKSNIIGICVCFFGTALIFNDTLTFTGTITSALLALGSSLSFALYTVLGKKCAARIGSLKMNAYSFLGGSTVLLLCMIIANEPLLPTSYDAVPQLLYMSFLVTGVAYIAYFKGLAIIGAGKGSLLYFLKPALVTIAATIFLHEKITLLFLTGSMLILFGLYIAIVHKREFITHR